MTINTQPKDFNIETKPLSNLRDQTGYKCESGTSTKLATIERTKIKTKEIFDELIKQELPQPRCLPKPFERKNREL